MLVTFGNTLSMCMSISSHIKFYIYKLILLALIILYIYHAALSSWNVHRPTLSATRKKMSERDFLALNKASVQSGLTTAQEQQQYRATHDIRKKDDSERTASRSTPKFDEDMTFGISTRYYIL